MIADKEDTMRTKAMVLFVITGIAAAFTEAHEGLFLKFSVGPGIMIENAGINTSGLTIAAKNHAVGWAFNGKFALFIGEFGGLLKKNFGEYRYINLDAFGPGCTWYLPYNIQLSVSGGYGQAAFAHTWTEATGAVKGKGYGINMSLEKEWMVLKRVGLGTGTQVFYVNTRNTGFSFLDFSLKGMATFYVIPVR